jgi:hypothetical protein
MPLTLTPETEALFALVAPTKGAKTTDATDDLYKLADPIHEMLEAAIARGNAIVSAVRRAEATEEEPNGFIYFEQVRQKAEGMIREANAAVAALAAVTDTAFQLDTYGATIAENVASHDERMRANAERAATVTAIGKAELANLRERAERGDELAAQAARNGPELKP